MRTAVSIERSVFISSSEADELSLPLLSKLQLPTTETETETEFNVIPLQRATLHRTVTLTCFVRLFYTTVKLYNQFDHFACNKQFIAIVVIIITESFRV